MEAARRQMGAALALYPQRLRSGVSSLLGGGGWLSFVTLGWPSLFGT